MRALYAAEGGAKMGKKAFDEWHVYQKQVTPQEAEYNPLGGISDTDEACANCQFFDSPNGCLIVMGDISPTGKSRFWTERIEPQEYVQKVEVVSSEKSVVSPIEKIQNWVSNLFNNAGGEETSPPPVGMRPIYVTEDGKRAFLIGSNNFFDRHDQVIPEVAHNTYIEWIKENPNYYPEFWIWHLGEKSRWGKADHIFRANNFTVATGLVDPGFEDFAKRLSQDANTGVSNGYFAILAEGGKEFLAWWPYEFTAMSASDVANVWMNDEKVLIQEGYMSFAEGDKALLRAKGVPDAFIDHLEKSIEERSGQVTNLGIGSKSVEEPPPNPNPPTPPAPPEPPAPQGNDILGQIATLMDSKLSPLVQRLEAVETGQKSFEQKLGKTQDELVTEQMMAAVAGASRNGHTPSQSTNNIVEGSKGEEQRQLNWLGAQLDEIMKQSGVRQ